MQDVTAMPAGDFASHEDISIVGDAERIWSDITRLGLERHIAELEVLGYTVVPPEKVGPSDLVGRLTDAVLAMAERRSGFRPDLGGQGLQNQPDSRFGPGFGHSFAYILLEDPAFREIALHPAVMAISDYMVGFNATAYSYIANIKGPGSGALPLHCDNVMYSAPFPTLHQIFNTNVALTDYSEEDGGVYFVPGSHRYYAHPTAADAHHRRAAISAPAGSLIMWAGGTWHGAFERRTPGWRMNLVMTTCRPHVRPQENYRDRVADEILPTLPPRFATLVGKHVKYGWHEEGPPPIGSDQYFTFMGRHAYD